MKLGRILATGTLAALLATTALAATDDVINAITQDLVAQGYTRIHVLNDGNTVRVEASGPNGSLERIYDGAGTVVREEVRPGGTTATTSGGSSIGDSDDGSEDDGTDDSDDDGRDDDDDSNDSGSSDDSDDDHGGDDGDDHDSGDDDDHGSDDDDDHGHDDDDDDDEGDDDDD